MSGLTHVKFFLKLYLCVWICVCVHLPNIGFSFCPSSYFWYSWLYVAMKTDNCLCSISAQRVWVGAGTGSDVTNIGSRKDGRLRAALCSQKDGRLRVAVCSQKDCRLRTTLCSQKDGRLRATLCSQRNGRLRATFCSRKDGRLRVAVCSQKDSRLRAAVCSFHADQEESFNI